MYEKKNTQMYTFFSNLKAKPAQPTLATYLVVQGVQDVIRVEERNEDERNGFGGESWLACRHVVRVLLEDECEVQQKPEAHARTQLAKVLEIELANAGVELATNPKVVDWVFRVATSSKATTLGDSRRKEIN